jgi:hypothetical protein
MHRRIMKSGLYLVYGQILCERSAEWKDFDIPDQHFACLGLCFSDILSIAQRISILVMSKLLVIIEHFREIQLRVLINHKRDNRCRYNSQRIRNNPAHRRLVPVLTSPNKPAFVRSMITLTLYKTPISPHFDTSLPTHPTSHYTASRHRTAASSPESADTDT